IPRHNITIGVTQLKRFLYRNNINDVSKVIIIENLLPHVTTGTIPSESVRETTTLCSRKYNTILYRTKSRLAGQNCKVFARKGTVIEVFGVDYKSLIKVAVEEIL